MTLERLAQTGWYKTEPCTAQEIAALFSIVDRARSDSLVESISDDLRFHAAYNGMLTLANIALRASGLRAPVNMGHQRVIESIESTLTSLDQDSSAKWVRKIKAYSLKRNITSYDSAGGVAPSDLAQILKDLPVFEALILAWLKQVRPELLV
jgi:hypothetical protein